eukprot:TRINITY_DN42953_c0_g1_i1.p1 TRINITY_DN42953_c0_g1~~TRINITY_DN42953_c0_g1_i1.p1  ORF type:complete len:292 (+),score=54.34 TRINITY_DN42953_c0_g1_i1:39-878(+)
MASQRLLRAVHLSPKAFAFLTASGAPSCHTAAFSGALALPSGKPSLLSCIAQQISAPPCLTLRINRLLPQALHTCVHEQVAHLQARLGDGAEVDAHKDWPDTVTVALARGVQRPEPRHPSVLVTARAGEAALRGAGHIEANDIFGSIPDASRLRRGSAVSVFAAARDACRPERHPAEAKLEEVVVEDVVRRLVHSRYPRGPHGAVSEGIFVGNGVWRPPYGVALTGGFVVPMPLQSKGSATAQAASGSPARETLLRACLKACPRWPPCMSWRLRLGSEF